MAREKTLPRRISEVKAPGKLYILASEGVQTEPKYFRDLEQSSMFVDDGSIKMVMLSRKGNPLEKQKEGEIVAGDPDSLYRFLKKYKRENVCTSSDEFWMIIDRDDWATMHHVDFDELFANCRKEGNFYVAMSNPCFEIWLILHFKSFAEISDEDKPKLMENGKISSRKNFIDGYLADAIGNGRGYNKIPNMGLFLPKIYDAIEHAEQIDDGEDYVANLGTSVHRLVRKLVKSKSK